MTPWSYDAPARSVEVREQARDGTREVVGPAADGEDRAADRAPVLADGGVAPEVVAVLVVEPGVDPGSEVVETFLPHRAPGLAHDGRIRRAGIEEHHRVGPPELLDEEGAAGPVQRLVVAVVAAAHGDDGPERIRRAGRERKGGEAAPGLAEHADRPRAPRLAGGPFDHLDAVVELAGFPFAAQEPVGIPGSADVHPKAGIAVPRDVVVDATVARAVVVALAVGHVLDDGRHGVGLRVLGEPEPSREAPPVGERDEDVLDLADPSRKVGNFAHVDPPLVPRTDACGAAVQSTAFK